MIKKALYIVSAMLIGVSCSFASDTIGGNADNGKAKSAGCAGCHGADGNSMAPSFPKIAGQHEQYIAKQLADFKSGARQDPMMAGQVAGLSEQDMADLGAYFASQTTKVSTVTADVSVGEKLYRGGDADRGIPACMACHGPSGKGMASAKFPGLSGQHSAYTEKQLLSFKDAVRSNDSNSMMRDVADKMTKGQIKAVSAYISGLQ